MLLWKESVSRQRNVSLTKVVFVRSQQNFHTTRVYMLRIAFQKEVSGDSGCDG